MGHPLLVVLVCVAVAAALRGYNVFSPTLFFLFCFFLSNTACLTRNTIRCSMGTAVALSFVLLPQFDPREVVDQMDLVRAQAKGQEVDEAAAKDKIEAQLERDLVRRCFVFLCLICGCVLFVLFCFFGACVIGLYFVASFELVECGR